MGGPRNLYGTMGGPRNLYGTMEDLEVSTGQWGTYEFRSDRAKGVDGQNNGGTKRRDWTEQRVLMRSPRVIDRTGQGGDNVEKTKWRTCES